MKPNDLFVFNYFIILIYCANGCSPCIYFRTKITTGKKSNSNCGISFCIAHNFFYIPCYMTNCAVKVCSFFVNLILLSRHHCVRVWMVDECTGMGTHMASVKRNKIMFTACQISCYNCKFAYISCHFNKCNREKKKNVFQFYFASYVG